MNRRLSYLLAGLVAACSSASDTPVVSPPPGTPQTCTPVQGTPRLARQLVASGFELPVDLQVAAGDRARLFIVEQAGRIRVIRDGVVDPVPFIDLRDRIGKSGGEQGLLGLAFHPQFAVNGRFFVNYTNRQFDTHISEFRVGAGGQRGDPSSERILLQVAQPFANHNGGGLAFGSDGRLYAGLGDGGSGGDPLNNAQNPATPLGKMLRIDVDAGTHEVWSRGLRNPWRFAFDRATGDLFIADVGQNLREEVSVAPGGRAGDNFGWRIMEAGACFDPPAGCSTAGLTLPVVEYGRAEGCSIIGGAVYRGCRMPGHHGLYFYSDFCTAFVRSFRYRDGAAADARDWTADLGANLARPSAFGVDADGELYIVSLDGAVYRVVPAP